MSNTATKVASKTVTTLTSLLNLVIYPVKLKMMSFWDAMLRLLYVG